MASDKKEPWPDAPLLIIDDDQAWTTMLTRALTSLGWKDIRSLTDPEHTVAIACEFRPALILLDLRIANKVHLTVLEDLHQHLPHIPIIIVTSIDEVDLAVSSMRRGACHYLVKPLSREKLREALQIAVADRECNQRSPTSTTQISDLPELPPLHEVKDILIDEAIRRSDGTISKAADMLGVTPQAICNRRRRAADAEDERERRNQDEKDDPNATQPS